MLTIWHPPSSVMSDLNLNATFWNKKTVFPMGNLGNDHSICFAELNIDFNTNECYSPVPFTVCHSEWLICDELWCFSFQSQRALKWSSCYCASVSHVFFSTQWCGCESRWHPNGVSDQSWERLTLDSQRCILLLALREYRPVVTFLRFRRSLWIKQTAKTCFLL